MYHNIKIEGENNMGVVVILIILAVIVGACSDNPKEKEDCKKAVSKGTTILFKNLFR